MDFNSNVGDVVKPGKRLAAGGSNTRRWKQTQKTTLPNNLAKRGTLSPRQNQINTKMMEL